MRLSVWLGAAAVTAGISAAMIAGAAVAGAETDTAAKPDDATTSAPARHDAVRAAIGQLKAMHPTIKVRELRKIDRPRPLSDHINVQTSLQRADNPASAVDTGTFAGKRIARVARFTERVESVIDRAVDAIEHPASAPMANKIDTRPSTSPLRSQSAAITAAAEPAQPTPLVSAITTVFFNTVTGLETIVTGPPRLPPNSTVTVKTSTLQIADGQDVPANWYYPSGDTPPERMILLQHGLLAIGPMYSYTAAFLAEGTDSIVVTPTLTSNPYATGGLWLGGDAEHEAVAGLFVGDRAALTTSAIAAGYGDQYDFGGAAPTLPVPFALVGHSLGGALVSGATGYLADDPSGAADNLVGVILLDGVPIGDQLTNALVKLDAYQSRTGHYIPVREIGAPLNFWNSTSNVNEALTDARPNDYNGVVLDGGVHMDSMLGGNQVIQFAAYVAAGFPQPQNPPAVQKLASTWLLDWFDGCPVEGCLDPAPGSPIEIDTPAGPATGVVLGGPPPLIVEVLQPLLDVASTALDLLV